MRTLENPGFGFKNHYVGASILMQDRYHFWAKMSQADRTSISTCETAVRTAAGRSSFDANAGEFIRDKFLFGLNESFGRFCEDIFHRDSQRIQEEPSFTLVFVMAQAISFETAQHTNQLFANSTTEEQARYTNFTTAPKLKKPPGRSCFFFGRKEQLSCNIQPNLQLLSQNRSL